QPRSLTECHRHCRNSGSDPCTSDCRYGNASLARILNHRAVSPKSDREEQREDAKNEESQIDAAHDYSGDCQSAASWVRRLSNLCERDDAQDYSQYSRNWYRTN